MAPIIATTIATDEVQPTGRNENLPTVNSELGDMDDPRTLCHIRDSGCAGCVAANRRLAG
jgi:hypothetical protein